jgi:hypothetical protein
MKRMLGLTPLVLLLAITACSGAAPATDGGNGGNDGESAAAGGGDNGGNGDDGGSASGFDLCDALSPEEVSEITGVEVVDTTSANSNGVLSCNYNGEDEVPVAGTTLATSESGVNPQQLFDANEGAEGSEQISGIGDEAWLTGSDDFPILMVMKNGNMYSLSVIADELDADAKREATLEIARRSVDRLP